MSNSPIISLTAKEIKDIKSFCKLNELDFEKFIKICFSKGYQIEKYGLLTTDDGEQIVFEEKIIEKEVIKEVPIEVEKIIEKVVIKEIPVEKIVEKQITVEVIKEVPFEVIKEVEKKVIVEVEKPKEVIVEKEVYITDDEQVKELGSKITKLEEVNKELSQEIYKKDESLDELRQTLDIELNKPPTEVEKIIEVIVEKPIEVIKEVKVVNKDKLILLQETISKMKDEIRKKDEKILQIENNVVELEKIKGPIKGKFMGSTNLNDNIYK